MAKVIIYKVTINKIKEEYYQELDAAIHSLREIGFVEGRKTDKAFGFKIDFTWAANNQIVTAATIETALMNVYETI